MQYRTLYIPALALLPLAGAVGQTINRFSLPNTTLPAGSTGNPLVLHASHGVILTGYSFAIRYQPAALKVGRVTLTGTSAAEAQYFAGRVDSVKGELSYGVVFSTSGDPLAKSLPPAADDTVAILQLDVLARAGTSSQVEPVDGVGTPPISNVFVDDKGQSVKPALAGSSVTIAVPSGYVPPVSDAGPDQFAAEGVVVTLDGSGSNSPQGRAVSYQWSQVSGPPAVFLNGSSDAQARIGLPVLVVEQPLR